MQLTSIFSHTRPPLRGRVFRLMERVATALDGSSAALVVKAKIASVQLKAPLSRGAQRPPSPAGSDGARLSGSGPAPPPGEGERERERRGRDSPSPDHLQWR